MSENNSQVTHGAMEATSDAATYARTESARAQLAAELCGLGATMSAAMEALPGFVPCGHAFGEVIGGLAAVAASDSEEELAEAAARVRARSEHVSAHRGVPQGVPAAPALDDPAVALLWAALRGIAVDVERAMRLGRMEDGLDVFLVTALAALGAGTTDHALLMRAGAAAKMAHELAA